LLAQYCHKFNESDDHPRHQDQHHGHRHQAPHALDKRPTLREKLHSGGFITIVLTHKKGKWIDITTTPAESKIYINTILKDLCKTIYNDGTAPSAAEAKKTVRLSAPKGSKECSVLFDTQSKSWAALSQGFNADNATNHTETNIAKRPPRTVQFLSKVQFDDNGAPVATQNETNTDNQTALSAPNSMNLTAITQDNLTAMEQRITNKHKKDQDSAISSTISALLANSNNDQTYTTFLAHINSRWEKQELQIQHHNDTMQDTMQTMKGMMEAMKNLVQATTSRHSSQQSKWSSNPMDKSNTSTAKKSEHSFDSNNNKDSKASDESFDVLVKDDNSSKSVR
jgi:hypothetical protein